ncbi:hypothetical protein EDD15DRAFT_2385097 [Pisolithus albus]|nr:hypothetical protein EDD15DRAFT_2385097 [Pisolithus albus]
MLAIWLVLGLCLPVTSLPAQGVLDGPQPHSLHTGDRGLHGRFLHITDVHPDPFYKHGAHPSTACHRKKPKKKRRAGYYGTAYKECDSPLALTNFTLDYLEERWSDEIDFVIWTGDSARHDNDDKIPRPLSEVYELNEAVAEKMKQVFSSKGIPVVPTIGKASFALVASVAVTVLPQETTTSGVRPNDITRTYSSYVVQHVEKRVLRFCRMWSDFIPPESRASFLQGGYFSVEVVPGALAVVSLNTMYFYSSNEGMCIAVLTWSIAIFDAVPTDDDDPGNQQFTWFEDQLKVFRSRQLQNLGLRCPGHVPPTDGHYYSRCYGRYVELSLRFQDTILGHLFGHLNTDHFYFMKADDVHVDGDTKLKTLKLTEHAASLFDALVADFSRLPGPQDGMDYGNYAVVNVNPSVVPNPYVPTFRAYVYNVTGLPTGGGREVGGSERYDRVGFRGSPDHQGKPEGGAMKWEGGPGRDELKACGVDFDGRVPFGSPSRWNLLWTPLGYAQYWMPKVEEYDARDTPEYELEYLTFSLSRLHVGGRTSDAQPLIPLENLPEELRDGGVDKSKYAPYGMDDLTIPSWVELARRIGKDGGKVRKRFRKYMYVGGKAET